MAQKVAQKTLVDLAEIFLAKKRRWNIDTTLKIVVGGTEIGAVVVEGKVEYVPAENEGKSNE